LALAERLEERARQDEPIADGIEDEETPALVEAAAERATRLRGLAAAWRNAACDLRIETRLGRAQLARLLDQQRALEAGSGGTGGDADGDAGEADGFAAAFSLGAPTLTVV